MEDYIPISTLNDFIFCPYSIYLHNVYYDSDESLYQAFPQTNGRLAHESIDDGRAGANGNEIVSLSVCSVDFGIYGKIDVFKIESGLLIERKYQLKSIYRGQIYQLWGEYYCMEEMGYNVRALAFYETSTNKMIPVELPNDSDKKSFLDFLGYYRHYSLEDDYFDVNESKCCHCIYCNLCDKTLSDNVYTKGY